MEKTTTAASILSDKSKIEQLTKYLTMSLEAHKQGNPKQLNQIFEELSSDKIDVDSVKVWMNIFAKILIESVSQPSLDCTHIIDFVLYQSKWLICSSKHLQAFDSYAKFCLALISIKVSYLPLIIKLLVQNLVPKEMYEDSTKTQNFNLVVGKNSFKNLHDLKQYVTAIIKNPKYELTSTNQTIEVDPDHSKFLYELFSFHPKAKQKLKNFSKILIGYNTIAQRPNKCFFIEKDSSEKEDISYLKACNAVYDTFAEQNLHDLLTNEQQALIENILNFLAKIFKLYPLSFHQLPSILREVFPHKRLDESIQRAFFINILKLSIKFEKLRTPILNICMEKLIQIDVEIKNGSRNQTRHELNYEMSKKLDWLLLIFFDYIDYAFEINIRSEKNCFGEINKKPVLEKEAKKHMEIMSSSFLELLEIFHANLLLTYQSKYVQYLFFYLCSYDVIYPDFMQIFISRLITNVKNEEDKKFVRINSMHYLRSLVVRAKNINFQVLYKTLGFIIDYLKEYIKGIRKKLAKASTQKGEKPLNFEKIELDASSKYRERLVDIGEQESEYKQLYQKYDMFYYINFAIVYILVFNNEKFVSNNQDGEYKRFVGLLVKYNPFFKTIKFLPKTLLLKFGEIARGFDSNENNSKLISLIEAELNPTEEEKVDEIRGDVCLEDYLPYDPNFLSRSKKVLLPAYRFISSEEENLVLMDNTGEEEEPNDGMNQHNGRKICDTLDDENVSDNLSSLSKHETDVSNEHLKALEESLKRKSKPLKGLENTEKRVKQNSVYLGEQKVQAGI